MTNSSEMGEKQRESFRMNQGGAISRRMCSTLSHITGGQVKELITFRVSTKHIRCYFRIISFRELVKEEVCRIEEWDLY